MKKYPSIWKLKNLVDVVGSGPQCEIDGKWVPSRPLPFYTIYGRARAAWLVFTGKADAVIWDGQ